MPPPLKVHDSEMFVDADQFWVIEFLRVKKQEWTRRVTNISLVMQN